jgi:beta-phosphoglucomutase
MVRRPMERRPPDRRPAVIFDMDGVLVLSIAAHATAWRATAERYGRPMTHADFLRVNGMTNHDICTTLWGAEKATPEFIARIGDEKERAYRDAVRADLPLAPGLRPLLQQLRDAGVALAVGTSGPQENVDLILDQGGIRAFFGGVVHAGLVRRGKPAPDIFLAAADLLGVVPAGCTVVEDAPTGVRAALAAGMRCVGVATTHAADELLAVGAHLVRPDLAALTVADLLAG